MTDLRHDQVRLKVTWWTIRKRFTLYISDRNARILFFLMYFHRRDPKNCKRKQWAIHTHQLNANKCPLQTVCRQAVCPVKNTASCLQQSQEDVLSGACLSSKRVNKPQLADHVLQWPQAQWPVSLFTAVRGDPLVQLLANLLLHGLSGICHLLHHLLQN